MSELLLDRVDLSPWDPTEAFPNEGRPVNRPVHATAQEGLPAVRRGQLWYVELPSTKRVAWPLEYEALTTANVVVYDRTLEPVVAAFLPLGAYAEPAMPSHKVIERCLSFTREGWSVTRLVDREGGRTGNIRQLSQRILEVRVPDPSAASIFINNHGHYENLEAELGELGDLVDRPRFGPAATVTGIFDCGAGTTPRVIFTSANGLAG